MEWPTPYCSMCLSIVLCQHISYDRLVLFVFDSLTRSLDRGQPNNQTTFKLYFSTPPSPAPPAQHILLTLKARLNKPPHKQCSYRTIARTIIPVLILLIARVVRVLEHTLIRALQLPYSPDSRSWGLQFSHSLWFRSSSPPPARPLLTYSVTWTLRNALSLEQRQAD